MIYLFENENMSIVCRLSTILGKELSIFYVFIFSLSQHEMKYASKTPYLQSVNPETNKFGKLNIHIV